MHRVLRIAVLSGLSFLLIPVLAAQGELVIVKEGTGLYHRPSCDVIRGATDILAMSVGQAEARGFKPHPDCDPSNPKTLTPPPASAAKGTTEKPRKPPAPVYVWIDAGSTLYHREGFRRLGQAPKKMVLDAATAKKYWPCGVCKAPILPRVKK
jgi:methylphosphotriester-DNA--protein-cysteine methyltransferase